MKFEQLNWLAQIKAIDDYITGWRETHPDEYLSMLETYKLLLDQSDCYTTEGELK
jgi:hypothetical protein